LWSNFGLAVRSADRRGRDIEVLDLDAGHFRRDAAGVALAAVHQGRDVFDGQPRGDRHAVPALLAGDLDVFQAHGLEGLARELAVLAFDFLHAQDVGRLFVDEPGGLFGAEADGIDIPGGDTKAHAYGFRVFVPA